MGTSVRYAGQGVRVERPRLTISCPLVRAGRRRWKTSGLRVSGATVAEGIALDSILRQGDCVALMNAAKPDAIDAIVTDPPYGLGFMGRKWDALPPGVEWAEACLRVLKPGGHILAFGGTRTYHRLACALEDGGFEIRDCLAWLYGSGFPKSLDVSKAIDKAAGAEREVIGQGPNAARRPNPIRTGSAFSDDACVWGQGDPITAPATPDAERWQGWGTALKPAHEPIVLARKPLIGTVAANVLEHGTGALNVDACRIATTDTYSYPNGAGGNSFTVGEGPDGTRTKPVESNPAGRWPANVCLDPEAAAILDAQTGSDTSRFFYCPKAGTRERNAGLDALEKKAPAFGASKGDGLGRGISNTRQDILRANTHPTVKPLALMRWLVRLVTPPDGWVLDPFMGSGTTGIAAALEGFRFVGLELEPEYVEMARRRIAHHRE
jgi:DNA modification methylase